MRGLAIPKTLFSNAFLAFNEEKLHYVPKRQDTDNGFSDGRATKIKFGWLNTFLNDEVDYFGPFIVKTSRKNKKRRCSLFTCLTVRTVHVQTVVKMDTEKCLKAIIRFLARRSKQIKLISDNGTNFVGAVQEFKEYAAAWNKERIEEHLVQQGVRWKLNSPAAPHFGGSRYIWLKKLS